MNKALTENIYSALRVAVSGLTQHIYFYQLPNEELLSELTVVYTVENTSNLFTFEDPEAAKTYSLTVQINDVSASQFSDLTVFIKESIYGLTVSNERVKHIRLNNEELFYDDELNIWTQYLRFEIQYS